MSSKIVTGIIGSLLAVSATAGAVVLSVNAANENHRKRVESLFQQTSMRVISVGDDQERKEEDDDKMRSKTDSPAPPSDTSTSSSSSSNTTDNAFQTEDNERITKVVLPLKVTDLMHPCRGIRMKWDPAKPCVDTHYIVRRTDKRSQQGVLSARIDTKSKALSLYDQTVRQEVYENQNVLVDHVVPEVKKQMCHVLQVENKYFSSYSRFFIYLMYTYHVDKTLKVIVDANSVKIDQDCDVTPLSISSFRLSSAPQSDISSKRIIVPKRVRDGSSFVTRNRIFFDNGSSEIVLRQINESTLVQRSGLTTKIFTDIKPSDTFLLYHLHSFDEKEIRIAMCPEADAEGDVDADDFLWFTVPLTGLKQPSVIDKWNDKHTDLAKLTYLMKDGYIIFVLTSTQPVSDRSKLVSTITNSVSTATSDLQHFEQIHDIVILQHQPYRRKCNTFSMNVRTASHKNVTMTISIWHQTNDISIDTTWIV